MGSSAVQNLIKAFTEQDLFSAPTDVYINNSAYFMAKPKLTQNPDPYIVFAQIKFKPGTRDQGLDGLKNVINGARSLEATTLGYNVLEDKENQDIIRIVSAYQSEYDYNNEHMKAAVVAENERRNKPNWADLSFYALKLTAGYLHKGRLPDHSGL
jgi:quinol monooxygenase YgiN